MVRRFVGGRWLPRNFWSAFERCLEFQIQLWLKHHGHTDTTTHIHTEQSMGSHRRSHILCVTRRRRQFNIFSIYSSELGWTKNGGSIQHSHPNPKPISLDKNCVWFLKKGALYAHGIWSCPPNLDDIWFVCHVSCDCRGGGSSSSQMPKYHE